MWPGEVVITQMKLITMLRMQNPKIPQTTLVEVQWNSSKAKAKVKPRGRLRMRATEIDTGKYIQIWIHIIFRRSQFSEGCIFVWERYVELVWIKFKISSLAGSSHTRGSEGPILARSSPSNLESELSEWGPPDSSTRGLSSSSRFSTSPSF